MTKHMKTRVLEICKERGISLSELAERIGVKQANLSQSLNGNPTLSTLQTVAEHLSVDVADLFVKPERKLSGYLEVNGKLRKVTCTKDLLPIVGTFGIPSFSNFRQCKKEVRNFVLQHRNPDHDSSFAAILDGKMLFNILSTANEDEVLFVVSMYAEGRPPMTVAFSDIEFGDGDGMVDWDDLIKTMWVEIVGGVDPMKDYSDKEMAAVGIDE